MAHINLLPWREEERKRKKNEFYTVVGAAVIAMAVAVLATHMYVAGLIDYQLSRNNFLKQEIVLVEKKIKEIQDLERKKEQLISRMRIIERLQGNRPEIVHLFDELAKTVPEGLFINTLEQKERNVVIKGTAQSNARVSAFMRALENSDWFEQPELDVISTKRSGVRKDRDFTLRVRQKNPEEAGS
jgi:type IV pilus assembly protein PilN